MERHLTNSICSPALFNVVRIGHGVNPPAGIPLDLYYKTINQYSECVNKNLHHKCLIIDGNEQYLEFIITLSLIL